MIRNANSQTGRVPLLDLDRQEFLDNFNRKPFKIGHRFCDHPLFTLESLVQLSQRLPADRVEYNAGQLPISQDPNQTPRTGLSISETIARIDQSNSWMVLKNVELDAKYRSLLHECLGQIEEYSELVSRGMKQEEGFIFVSSPGSVTPFHIDPENNFLLQVCGTKSVWMFDQNDRKVLKEQQIEEFFSGAHRNLEFDESFRARGERIELNPGEGLHFPVVAPHYVENGSQVSVSFSITFQTKDSADRQALHRLNRRLRRFGLSPSGVGQSIGSDRAKLAFLNSCRFAKQRFSKQQ